MLLVLALLGGGRPAQMPSPRAISALLYLTAAGSIVAYSAFCFLVRSVRPVLAFSYAYVNPLIAVVLGALVAGETVRPATVGALALVVAGVSAIVRA